MADTFGVLPPKARTYLPGEGGMPMDVKPYMAQLCRYIEDADFAGYDPYDALNSPMLSLIGRGNRWVRIVSTQALKRCPINLRRVLGIRREHNPKGLGLLLGAYCKLYAVESRDEYLQTIIHLLDLLERFRSTGYSGNCWGYNFDWQARRVYRPKYTPTVVNTSFIGHALLDAIELANDRRAAELVESIPAFMLNDLKRKVEGDTFCFSYSPVDHDYVHNANALGASFLIRFCHLIGDTKLRQAAYESMGYCMKHQHESGAWPFGTDASQKWVDSFHTGFVLESLKRFLMLGEGNEWRRQYALGVEYYAKNLFLEDGTPKYFDRKVYPIDIHAPAEAICFFSGETPKYRGLTERILRWLLINMWDQRGYFHFRCLRYYRNRIPYMRWGQAWGLRALAEYLFNIHGNGHMVSESTAEC